MHRQPEMRPAAPDIRTAEIGGDDLLEEEGGDVPADGRGELKSARVGAVHVHGKEPLRITRLGFLREGVPPVGARGRRQAPPLHRRIIRIDYKCR